MNNNNYLGFVVSLQLFLIEIILLITEVFFYKVSYYINLNLYSLVCCILLFYFSVKLKRINLMNYLGAAIFGIILIGMLFGILTNDFVLIFGFNFITFIGLTLSEKIEIKNYKDEISFDFQLLLITYLLLLVTNEFYSIRFININYLLALVIPLGIATIILQSKNQNAKKEHTKKSYIFGICLGIISGILIFIKTKELGYLSYLIALLLGAIIVLTSMLILEEDKNEKKD